MKKVIAITDERISPLCERKLSILGFKVCKMPAARELSFPVASHPDMLFFYHNNTLITSADYCENGAYIFTDIRELSKETKFFFTNDSFKKDYPYDAIFNALVIGNKLFCKTDSVSRSILDHAKKFSLEIINVNQGYPACTTLALSDKEAITADRGMAKSLSGAGINVTLIENGDIALPPYEYGFIGGTAGVYNDKIYFLGNPSLHRSGDKIFDCCRSAGLEPIALSNEPLCDLGRIVFIEYDA